MFRFGSDFLHARIVPFHQKSTAVEAEAAEDSDSFCHQSDVEDWFGELQMAEMAGTLGEIAGTRLASAATIQHALSRVHEPAELRFATFVDLWILDLRRWHAPLKKATSACKIYRMNNPL